MDFEMALEVVRTVLPLHQYKQYDGIIVKKLESSNTLDENRTTNQTHIAISGDQMNIFPYLAADGYFNCNYGQRDESLKKYFIAQVPFYIYENNVVYLSGGVRSSIDFEGRESRCVHASIVRSRRKEQSDQVQLSLATADDPEFIAFRKLLHIGDYLILLKHKEQLFYDCLGVKAADGVKENCRISALNNKFYKLSTNTKVDIQKLTGIVDYEKKDVLEKFELRSIPTLLKTDFSRRFITSLLAKPFVILTGNSGTGKTRIARQLSEYLEVTTDDGEKNWLIVPVGADWTDNVKVLGFFNPLADDGEEKYVKTNIVKLIERADRHKDIPYFLVLDEMNLSHVERYFSDFLSHMETPGLSFELEGYEGELEFPDNLFVVGTVNIDETTYMFSPKVLDRANVIEFKPEKEDVLGLFAGNFEINEVVPANNGTAEAFLELARRIRTGTVDGTVDMQSVKSLFEAVYDIVEKYGFEFAYRTVKEIRQYIFAAYGIAGTSGSFNLNRTIDEQILQKVLPKIHGNKKEIGSLLDELGEICINGDVKLELSAKKIDQMKGKLAKVQYASFI